MVDNSKEQIKYTTVKVSEILSQGIRFEATVFDVEGKRARKILDECGYELTTICGNNGLATAYHRPRFKRIWVDKSIFPIYQPAQILDIHPKPSGYISDLTDTDIESLRVKEGQILLTCSGTIGNTTIVSEMFKDKIFSHDLIRINPNNEIDKGYIYAYLNTKTGRTILETNNYGAVISHIEPEHLASVPIPNIDEEIKKEINGLIELSFKLRDESNNLMDEARDFLIEKLSLPNVNELNKEIYTDVGDLENYNVKLSEMSLRFDSSFNKPVFKNMRKNIMSGAKKVVSLGDNDITKDIILAGVFKRVYVEKGSGYPFLGGREITQLNPKVDKYLSKIHHKARYEKELKVTENTILVTDRGTIGKVAIVPKHFEGYAVSQNVIKIDCIDDFMAGYVYAFLSSEYGISLIKKETYGSVVDMIDDNNLRDIKIPILHEFKDMKYISDKVLEANKKRYEAYEKEEKAIDIVNKKVLKLYNNEKL